MSVDLLPAIRSAASELTADGLAAPILVGVSGGPDSLALLHALGRWRAEGGPAIAAIHVDHKLRPGSADEARQVAAWCAEWRIPFAGRVVEADRAPVANVEQIAREGRYRCFAQEAAHLGALTLALAHHADDQAETLLLHLLRGSGLAGLAGMPVVRRAGDLLDPVCAALGVTRPAVWRPLLAVRRAAILAYCEFWQFAPIHDPSNDDTTLRRNAIRHRIMPVVEEYFPGAGGILARNAALLADDEDVLRFATDEALARCVVSEPGLVMLNRAVFGREHPAMQRRLLRAIWGSLRDNIALVGLDADTVEAARDAILAGRTGSQHSLPSDLLLIIERDRAAFGPVVTLEDQLRRRLGLPLVESGWMCAVPAAGTLALDAPWSIEVLSPEADRVLNATLHIPNDEGERPIFRTWQSGDRVALSRESGSRKLQDWFTDRHIPGYARRSLPLLARGNWVLWVAGLAVFPPAARGCTRGAAICLRLLYNGLPIEPIRRH